jgi:hypothetical protein
MGADVGGRSLGANGCTSSTGSVGRAGAIAGLKLTLHLDHSIWAPWGEAKIMLVDARDPLFSRCTTHQLRRVPNPPSPEPAISLSGSVGKGGSNLRSDVLKIQAALNTINPADGGPVPKLVVDGICGPLTIGAIGRFQQRVLTRIDSRIDVNGPTLKALNARLASSGPPSSLFLAFSLSAVTAAAAADDVVKSVLDRVNTIRGALFLARSRIESIAPFVTPAGLVTPSGSGSERDKFNLDLVDEVFRLSDFVQPVGAYNRLRFQFENMLQALRVCDPSKGVADNGLFLRNPSPLMETISVAFVARSGRSDPDPSGLTEDNVEISTKRIYITGLMDRARGRRDFIAAVSHELAHFVSPFGFSVIDTFHGHSSRDEQPFRDGVYDRIANAENYGWFAWRSFEGKFAF